MKLSMQNLAVLSATALLITGCHTQPSKPTQTPIVQANYGIEGFEADDEDIPMPEPVDLSTQKGASLKDKAIEAYSAAVNKNQQVAKLGFDWNVTYDLLKKAEKELKAENFESSISKSNVALSFAEAGIKQHKASEVVVPRYAK